MTEQEKYCRRCQRCLPLNEFWRDRTKPDGLTSPCKSCKRAKLSPVPREQARAYEQKYRDENRDVLRQRSRAWRQANLESARSKEKSWRDRNPETVAKKNKRALRERQKHPTYAFRMGISRSIRVALRGKKSRRSTFKLLGYSVLDLMGHLERNFQSGMSWANYGEWHVDHRRPVASFSFETDLEGAVRECWGLANLRPMWAEPNKEKSSFWDGSYWRRGARLGAPHLVQRVEPLFARVAS
jgi:hypothetical protein